MLVENDLCLKNVSAFVRAFDTNPLRWIKQCWPWEEGCGINGPAWIAANFTLILAHLALCLYSFEVHTYLKRELSSGALTRRKGMAGVTDRLYFYTKLMSEMRLFAETFFVV